MGVVKDSKEFFPPKQKILDETLAWRHKFVCLAYVDQSKIPSTDYDKDELYQAGLGEKEITFEDINITQSQFKGIIFESFPKLEAVGGFRFLKG